MSFTDVETSLEDKEDADVKGRKFETTTEATWDIEVKPVELLISEPNNDDDDADVDADDMDEYEAEDPGSAVAVCDKGGVCSLSSSEGNNIVLL